MMGTKKGTPARRFTNFDEFEKDCAILNGDRKKYQYIRINDANSSFVIVRDKANYGSYKNLNDAYEMLFASKAF